MRVGICEWSALAGEEAVFQRLQRTGLEGMQVSYSAEGFVEKMQRYAALASRYGIILTSVGANIFCERPVFDFGGRDRLVATVQDICRGTALTQGRVFHVPAFGASHIPDKATLAATAEALRRICDTAAEFDVWVGAENALSLEENRWLLQEVARPNLRLYFDTQNPQTSPHRDATAQATAFASQIPEVHVKDCDKTGRSVRLGTGVTRFSDTLKALVDGGYDGWLLLENDYSRTDDPEEAMREDRQRLMALLGEGVAE